MNIKAKAAGLALLLTLGLSSVASAASGYVTGNVNLRAGPSTSYPVVVTLVAGEGLEIFGCLSGYSWCDVDWNGYRGWVSSNYLQTVYQSRRVRLVEAPPTIISFSFGSYWDNYYRGRPFYRDRDRYDRREVRQDRRERRRDVRQDRREDRREARQDRRQERRQEARQERRQESRQERRAERRENRQERRNCPPGAVCN
jgi:uncharacterized protein YraI